MEKSTNKYKSVSDLLNKAYGNLNLYDGGKRGKVFHEMRSRFYKETFKSASSRSRTSYTVFSQRVSKTYSDILGDARKNQNFALYYEDLKILLNALKKEVLQIAKFQAKSGGGVVIPEDIETKLFGGYISFECEAIAKIKGINIPARIDDLIELDSGKFVIRDFKSYSLEKDEDPKDEKSEHHREFMEICLYGIIFEEDRHQQCERIQLVCFPNKLISFEFTEELKKLAIEFAVNTAFEGFDGVFFDFSTKKDNESDDHSDNIQENIDSNSENSEKVTLEEKGLNNVLNEKNCLGWLNTIKGKPLELNKDKEDKLDGYLFPKNAHLVKDGNCVIVETQDVNRIMCVIEKIECFEDHVTGETSSHKEENYKIRLNPKCEFTPEGLREVMPQTIIHGKIVKPTKWEFFQFKKIPLNGIQIGTIEGQNEEYMYPLDGNLLFQSVFIGGIQGTGKTSSLRFLIMASAQQKHSPAIISFDAEEEYGRIVNYPTNERSAKLMEMLEIKKIDPSKFNVIKFGENNATCLTLKAVDPLDLPLFLHDLTSVSFDTLERIIQDIKNDHKGRDFTFPELKQLILKYVEKKEYRVNPSTKSAIERALMAISLDLFDVPGVKPIEIESMLKPGKITIIDCFELKDEQQRLIALYMLSALHKHKMKEKKEKSDLGVVFILDEVQRIVPKLLSSSEYQKRIVHFLEEIHHRGRKREYGIIYATQSPLDVKKEIVDLCNTKIFFQIQGSGSEYLKEYFPDKEQREQLKQLPEGRAFILSKGMHDPIIIKFPFIN